MKNPDSKVVGLTGSIGTGKSYVASQIEELGFPVICADKIVHLLYEDPKIVKAILNQFGKEYANGPHAIDRKQLGELVFHDQEKRKELESILHPEVRKAIRNEIETHKKNGFILIFVDIPLLFESEWDKELDGVICVATTQKVQLERLAKHRGLSRRAALARIKSQMPLREKVKRANWVIHNNRSRSETTKKTREIIAKILET